jgi:hypothetical protein
LGRGSADVPQEAVGVDAEVRERADLPDSFDRPYDVVDEVQQVARSRGDHLGEQVQAAGGEHRVHHLAAQGEFVGDRPGIAVDADAEQGHGLSAHGHRVVTPTT